MKEAQALVRTELPSEKYATIVLKALMPETGTSPARRSRVVIRREGRNLVFVLRARDTTALRASINSYMRWVMVIEDALSTLDSVMVSQGQIRVGNGGDEGTLEDGN